MLSDWSELFDCNLGRNKELWMALDLEKAFDRVPRKVVWWALGFGLGVDEWIVSVIKASMRMLQRQWG